MARIRTIKPRFWSSPDLPADPWTRLLYIAMWNYADDSGRGPAGERELLGFAFPNDEELNSADIRRMLGGIRLHFGVVFYKVEGRPYFYIPSWDKHQKIDKRSDTRLPAPEEGFAYDPTTGTPLDQQLCGNSGDSPNNPPNSRGGLGGDSGLEVGSRKLEVGKKSFSSPKAPPRDDVQKLCDHMLESVKRRDPKSPAKVTAEWVTSARLLLDRDGRLEDEAHRLIDWVERDGFWQKNILSMPKFREQYTKLLLNAKSGNTTRSAAPADREANNRSLYEDALARERGAA